MVGIILAGGNGTRLYPLTDGVSKQLLPIYSVPMIYHPLCLLLDAGIKDIVVITNTENVGVFSKVLGDGKQWGVNIKILPQAEPKGIAEAYLIAEEIIDGRDSVLVLGDNIFYGCEIGEDLRHFMQRKEVYRQWVNESFDCMIYGYKVRDPQRYGVIEFDENYNVKSIEEKPQKPKSSYAAVGLYVCDGSVCERVKKQKPSARGELEITDLMKSYLYDETSGMITKTIGSNVVWLDAGTKRSYVEAINFVEAIEERTGKMIACPEEKAYYSRLIVKEQLIERINNLPRNEYREYLEKLLK